MSATEALRAANEAGITVKMDGEGLLLQASTEPSQAVVQSLANEKLAILALLRSAQAKDWRTYFEVRTAVHRWARAGYRIGRGARIRGHRPALAVAAPRSATWYGAWLHSVRDQKRSPWQSSVPVLAGAGHLWVHSECHAPWLEMRLHQAALELCSIGVCPQQTPPFRASYKRV